MPELSPTDADRGSDLVGAVAIGRNEGERLRRCLESLAGLMPRVIYVDSGSTDGSVVLARDLGATVVELDLSIGFTAARARNAGWQRLLADYPDTTWIQFIDGDCELVHGWLTAAVRHGEHAEQLAAICGRLRERYPETSIYNRLCDMEWNTPIGETTACGGIALIRADAVQQVDGFDPRLIAGEEPEMCFRMRQQGWRIERIDHEMAWHDANMTRFWQWFRRNQRCGHAYAESVAMHGKSPERTGVRESRSVWFWGLVFPGFVLAASVLLHPACLLALLIYPLQLTKIALQRRRERHDSWQNASLYAASCVLGKWPQLCGQCGYLLNRLRGQRSTLIEYKGPAGTSR